ncbi:TauD/TfdA family dioxygenase [Chroococcidiopsidales cyanobacterium LEGE 13417]|nr:TauD/TfdA family dioxygenase [Chroococcidiopsidales cyanobacterium LEGE 13417]
MKDIPKPSLKNLSNLRRKAINLSQVGAIAIDNLLPNRPLPLLIQPTNERLDLCAWAKHNREAISTYLLKHGGILFRNFQLNGAADFEQFIQVTSGELLPYTYRSTPRSHVSGNIYTSTEYPASQSIPLHNEMSYSRHWCMKIYFYCFENAQQGGETPIADSRRVFARIDPRIREKFQQKQVMYVRNYRKEFDLSWENVFQTSNKSEVENYCHAAGIEVEWLDKDRLRTKQVCQAIATHPKTGEIVWFNQAHLFHVSNLNPSVRVGLLAGFKKEELPRNAYYGDGSPIEDSVLEEIREIYQQEAIIFPWQTGDVLLLDNMLSCHGRMPFVGSRKVLVGMSEPFSSSI